MSKVEVIEEKIEANEEKVEQDEGHIDSLEKLNGCLIYLSEKKFAYKMGEKHPFNLQAFEQAVQVDSIPDQNELNEYDGYLRLDRFLDN